MDAFDTSLSRRPRAVGLKLGVIFLVLLVVVGAWAGAYWWAKSTGRLKQVEHVVAQMDYTWLSWMSKGAKKATYVEKAEENGRAAIDPRDEQLRRMQRELDEQRRALEALRQQKAAGAAPAKTAHQRATAIYVVNAEKRPEVSVRTPLYTLAVWEYIPCVLESIVNAEIPGMFTLKLTRPVLDATRQHVLLPQGQRVGAKAATADLLFGNERIPTFALSASLPNGQALDLGAAPIMDAAGTNGLTGDVENQIWRLIWTSVFIGGLQGGQQVLPTQIGSDGVGPIAGGMAREGSAVTQQRLGRAQDTRPVITAHSGELCNILIPAPMQLPSFAAVPR